MKRLSILLILISFNLSAQSPWTKKKKQTYLQISYSTISNYNELHGNPVKKLARNISDNTLQMYGEYGISDKTTLVLSVPFKSVSSKPTPSSNENAFGNIQLGIKHNFYNKKWLLTGQLNLEANTSTYDKATGLRTGYNAWSFTPLLVVGRGFNSWYVQAFTGFDIRTNDYSSNYKLGAEIGYKMLNWLWIASFLDSVTSLNNGDIELPAENLATGLYINNQSYTAYGFKLITKINEKIGANLGLGGAFSGNNVAITPVITFGIYYKL